MLKMHNVKRISGYNQAARYFEATKKPRSVCWGEDERPLYNTAAHHYRITKGDDNGIPFYELVLYYTAMVRFYAPDQYNYQRVLVRGHSSTTSHQFLRRHGFGPWRQLVCVNGVGERRVGRLVLNPSTHRSGQFNVPSDFSADLTFIGDPDDGYKIDTVRSRHIPVYKSASSAADTQARKAVKKAMANWIDLMSYRLEEFKNTELNTFTSDPWAFANAGEAFSSALDMLRYPDRDALRRALEPVARAYCTEVDANQDFINAVTILALAVVVHLKGYNHRVADGKWDWKTQQRVDAKDPKPVTREDFVKSMNSHIISLLGIRDGTARVDVGQFPESIPRRFFNMQ